MDIPSDVIENLRNDPQVRKALAESLKNRIIEGELEFKDQLEILKLFKAPGIQESEESRIKALEDAIARNTRSREK